MNYQETSSEFFATATDKEGLKIDYRRVLYRLLRYWYLVVFSLLIALTVAFLRNRYAQRVYPVSASIIIKESKETAGGELLYSNVLSEPYRNYLNELYIIKSYPLIQSVIEDLNFGVSFYREGNILTSELYDYPVSARVLNIEQVKSCGFNFKPLSNTNFELETIEDVQPEKATFAFNDTIFYHGVNAVFTLKHSAQLSGYINVPVMFQYMAPENLTGSYVGRLGAGWAEEGSGVINLYVSGLNPEKERDFLKGFIRSYQKYDLENKNEIASRTIAFITDQLNEISDSLKIVESMLVRFKGKNVITDLSSETTRLYEQMETVELQRTEMIIRENYYKYLSDYIEKDNNLDQVILPSSVGITDPVLSLFISEMIEIQFALKLAIGREKLDNPLMREKRERLQVIRNSIIESIRNQKGTDKIRKESLDKRIRVIEQQLSNFPEAERQYIYIRRNYSLLENLYTFLLQKRAEANISQAASISDIAVVNPPMAGGPISPKVTQNYLIAGGVGLALPILIFILLEIFNTRIQSKDDIEKFTKIPFIGGVGHKTSDDNRTVLSAPKSAVAESFRALRSNLTYFLGDRKNIVVLVTSSISGEGKTFTSINLATVLSLSGKRTLIVGADMRKPKLFNDFSLNNDIGLSSYLVGLKKFNEVVQRTGEENLDLVSGGPVPPNPSELVLGDYMKTFFIEARTKYDYIIVDSPPLALVADAFVLNDHADHMIFVTRQDYTPKQLLKSLDEHYKSGRIKNISLLLNDIFKSGPGYGYGYSYGYGYGYGKRKNGNGYYTD